MLIEQKFDELKAHILRQARSWRTDESRYDDIVQSTFERLLIENAKREFVDARVLWGRATNIARECIAQSFADRLPVSGVKHQAHWTATKALAAHGGDPRAAYAGQQGTSRVGRELMFAVAHGPSLYSPEYLADIDPEDVEHETHLSTHDEDNIRVAIASLTEREQQVVRLRMWMRYTNAQAAEELGIGIEAVRKAWSRAQKTLKPILQASLGARYKDDM